MATKHNSRTAKSGLNKKPRFVFRWWYALIFVLFITLVGIVVLRFSRASGNVGLMLVDGTYTRHDRGSYVASQDGVAWVTSVNTIGADHWQWYGPFENLQVWPDNVSKSVEACWTLKDNRPFGIEAEYVLDATANNGSLSLASRTVSGQAGAFKSAANALTIQCLDIPLRNGRYDYGQVEYRLSMRKGSVSIYSMSRTLNGAVFSNLSLPTAKPDYIWPLLPDVGVVRGNDAQGGGCWGNPRAGGRQHAGLDILAPNGSVVVAARGGTVINIDSPPDIGGFGHYIIIDHHDGTYALYGHVENIVVTKGQDINQGQQIASVGNGGNAEGVGSQLHFQVQTVYNNSASVNFSQTINPVALLPKTRSLNGCK